MQEEYSRLRKAIKKSCRADKNTFISNICLYLEAHANKMLTTDLFDKVRVLSGSFKPKAWVIDDPSGRTLHDLGAIAERWSDYYADLYKEHHRPSNRDTDWTQLELEPDILRSEITAALKSLKPIKLQVST